MTRDELIEQGIPLVREQAKYYVRNLPHSVKVDELIAAGYEGLVKAADKFWKDSNTFRPYASKCIRYAMVDELRERDVFSRSGRRVHDKIGKAWAKFMLMNGREPTDEETAEALGWPLELYRKRLHVSYRGNALIDMEVYNDDHYWNGEDSVIDMLIRADKAKQVQESLEQLSIRNQAIMKLYFVEEKTLKQIGEMAGVNESRICQIVGEVKKVLREIIEGD